MPTRYRKRSNAAARVIQRAAIRYLRRKGTKRAKRTRTTRKQKQLTRSDVLSIIKSKQDPKYLKYPIAGSELNVDTAGTLSNIRVVKLADGQTGLQFTQHTVSYWKLPQQTAFKDSSSFYGDGRQGASIQGFSQDDEINLSKLTARLEIKSPTRHEVMLCYWIIHVPSMLSGEFINALEANQIIVQYKSYLTVHQQQNEQDEQSISNKYRIIQRGKRLIKAYDSAAADGTDYNNREFSSINLSITFGKNGKKVRFDSDTDEQGDIGIYFLVIQATLPNGTTISQASNQDCPTIHGLMTTYFTDIIT